MQLLHCFFIRLYVDSEPDMRKGHVTAKICQVIEGPTVLSAQTLILSCWLHMRGMEFLELLQLHVRTIFTRARRS